MAKDIRPPFMLLPVYKVMREFTFDGKKQRVGFGFKADMTDQRKLRQLYEARYITVPTTISNEKAAVAA
jgi:hypothetical protein